MAFHFLDKDMMRNMITSMFFFYQTITGICRSNMVPAQEKACVEIRKNTE